MEFKPHQDAQTKHIRRAEAHMKGERVMSYIATQYDKLDTELGTLLLWCNGTDESGLVSIGIRTEHAHNRSDRNAPAGGWEGVAESVTVNRVAYYLHAHLKVSRDSGEVHEGQYSSRGGILRKAEQFSLGNGSDSAEAKAWDIVSEAVSRYVMSDTGRKLIRSSVYAQANNEKDELERKAAELSQQLGEVRKAISSQGRKMARNAPTDS